MWWLREETIPLPANPVASQSPTDRTIVTLRKIKHAKIICPENKCNSQPS
jgi:hypothetical protein